MYTFIKVINKNKIKRNSEKKANKNNKLINIYWIKNKILINF